jgi:predicted 3-demethylubiquinone-9 3-methyltransferase (glyoxalase superfamily)
MIVSTKKISPCLWFDNRIEEAVNFYISVFGGNILNSACYPAGTPMPEGSVMMITFRLQDEEFVALNGGPHFKFTEAISLFVDCETQQEVDDLWERLSAGGEKSRCGWLKDKYGLSWQIIPKALGRLMGDKDPEKSKRVMMAMLQMGKIDIAGLQRAYDGG